MEQTTFKQRMRYRFDTFMARGGSSIFISLVVSFLILLIAIFLLRAIVVTVVGDAGLNEALGGGYLRALYVVFLQMMDPGVMVMDEPSSAFYKITAIASGFAGVVVLSALIAVITTALDQKLRDLRKGHSMVIEEEHTLILGWGDRVIEILRELVIANESEEGACVVILSERDKEEMDDFLRLYMKDPKTTRVVTRSGSCSSLVNLQIASIDSAKSVIALAYCTDDANEEEQIVSDTRVLKTILAVMATKGEEQELNIVAELFTPRSREIAEAIDDCVTTVDAQEILAKILVQTSRSVGLSVVYGEALSFDGCEMYFYNADWRGVNFGTVQFHFPDGVPLGVRKDDGSLMINPPIDYVLDDDDDVLILAEDDSTIDFESAPVATARDIPLRGIRQELEVEHELIIGWNAKVPILLTEYDDYVLDGSRIDVLVNKPSQHVRDTLEALQEDLESVTVTLIDDDAMRPNVLAKLEPFRYNNIIILSENDDTGNSETTDSRTIVILLLLRHIFADNEDQLTGTKLVTEVMNSENQELVARAGVHDFIISNRFVSMILGQVSEECDIKRVYDDLFSEDGSEIYLKPASLYFESTPVDVSFADMMRIAQLREEVCIGVKIQANERDMNANFGVKLIPEKNTRYTLQAEDCLVVVSEDET
jgi:ion channel POLLUX/CASTOR